MESVKFVPPGGHRACLSCSAAKAKCVFPDDGSVGGSRDSVLGSFGVSGFENSPDGTDIYTTSSISGVQACPRCERCERLDRDCLLPVRPRKKRRVGPLKFVNPPILYVSQMAYSPLFIPLLANAHPRPGTSRAAADFTPKETAESAGAVVIPLSSDTSIHAASCAITAPPYAATSASGSSRPTPTPPPKLTPTPPPPAPSQSQSQKQPAPPLRPSPVPSTLLNVPNPLVLACLHMEGHEADRTLRFFQSAFVDCDAIFRLTNYGSRAADLQANRPALWLAIVFATSYHDFEYQNRLARSIINFFCEQLFQHSDRRLDLLQGVLVFLSCFTTQNFTIPLSTTLLHMAMSLVSDLGLDRLESLRMHDRSPLEAPASIAFHGSERARKYGHTLDERAALAVCYCITNSVSACVSSMTPLQYTLQIEDACRFFETGKGNAPATDTASTGSVLAITVRMYYLIRRVLQVRQEADFRDGRFLTPVHQLTGQYVAELENIVTGIPPEVQSDKMHIYKLGITNTSGSTTNDASSSNGVTENVDGPGDNKIRCFIAADNFFEVFLSIPVADYFHLPITTFSQLVHADVTLAMLTAYYRGNTRPSGVPAGVTLPAFDDVMDKLASRFQRARFIEHRLGFEMRNHIYDKFAERLRSFKCLGLSGRRKPTVVADAKGGAKSTQNDGSARHKDLGANSDMRIEPSLSSIPSDSLDVRMEGTLETLESASVSKDTLEVDYGIERIQWSTWDLTTQSTILSQAHTAAILYTAYVEREFLRNVPFFSFLIDGLADDRHLDLLWDVYYHLHIDDATTKFLRAQVHKLAAAADTLEHWRSGPYGRHLRFSDSATFRDLQDGILRYEAALASLQDGSRESYEAGFAAAMHRVETLREQKLGNMAVLTGFRSVAPLYTMKLRELPSAHDHFWKHGTTSEVADQKDKHAIPADIVPNPTFAASVSNSIRLHYGSDPVLGYHLATAFTPLKDTSPLRAESEAETVPGAFAAVRAARTEFRAMAGAFQAMAHGEDGRSVTVRFVTADALVLCHTLQNLASSSGEQTSANWFRRGTDSQVLRLDAKEYGKGTSAVRAPVIFDVIDTSNLADHVGALNLLVAGVPLLANRPSSSLLTELLVKRKGEDADGQETFARLLCGHTLTVALLLGVAPVEYYTNARTSLSFEEMMNMAAKLGGSEGGKGQLRSRLTWKLSHHVSGLAAHPQRLQISADDLASALMGTYRAMFSSERAARAASSGGLTRKGGYPCFHCGSFAALVRIVKDCVTTDWADVCHQLLRLIEKEDGSTSVGSTYLQDLLAHLDVWDIYSDKRLGKPGLTAVTFSVPRNAFNRLSNAAMMDTASPALAVAIRNEKDSSICRRFADIQVMFGTVAIRKSPDDTPADVRVDVLPDPELWKGTAPLVVCLYVPTALAQNPSPTDTISLELHTDPLSLYAFGLEVGAMGIIYSAPLADRTRVHVSRFLPGQDDYPAVCPPVPASQDVARQQEESIEGETSEVKLEVDRATGKAISVTGRINFDSARGRALLSDKNIDIKTVSPERSPFAVGIVISSKGEPALVIPVHFPVPVAAGEGVRLRVARTSGWIEVVAPAVVSLPAMAERCRTWSHDPTTCAYAVQPDAKVPVSLEPGGPVLCACGQGQLPPDFVAMPMWTEVAARFATRIAISPVFCDPSVEPAVALAVEPAAEAPGPQEPVKKTVQVKACGNCGATEAKGGPLKKCLRCLAIKYCSAPCQKQDWLKHRLVCEESPENVGEESHA
ncbi:zinc finger, mynd-type domain containing protein [Grosmannia clavigera kw1407]|uniref:Zinc finger, mynd-type domain containing protein n=1 Tax=Grosmannia clavigera (strain kw1407 / UAMH 11150) TaxID=655863 RepID=F0XFZ1_GROCL|nr:zinc finger, mynd-type domain containing protein [Grosmannia clavigera kw1407]EFX03347.1 zinc finger, mynd-type domain containing protein [Grosmannia clavigera kw1407]